MSKRNKEKPNGFFGELLLWYGARICCCMGILCCSWEARSQRVDFTYKTYGLEVDADNVIQNAGELDDFFEHLYQLQLTNAGRVSIVHIGDSHIQADYLTAVVRRNFHRDFGNAGRGLIVPLNVAGTNEPNNFKTESHSVWKSKRCVFPDQPLPIGIGGVTIETTDPDADLEIFMNDLWLDYSFNALTIFYEKDEKSFDLSVRDADGTELAKTDSYNAQPGTDFSRVTWKKRVNAVAIQTVKSNPQQSRAILYGFVLENSANGVLYNTIGVNGAKFSHYNDARYFAQQTAGLQPDLFIISLGTNESLGYPYVDRTLPEQVDKMISGLQTENPEARFILVTPQDVYRNRNKPNPGILQVRKQIIQYAVDNGLAFYDMYRAMGGDHSAKSWSESDLLRGDGIHLTKDGYEYEGNLFYHALMKSYNSYVPTRHP